MIEVLQFEFMQRAFIAGIITAVIAPLIGIFLVARRYSLLADTLAHVSLVGIVIAGITGINPVISAMVTTVIASFFMEKLRSARQILGESVQALFLSGSLAVAAVLMSFAPQLQAGLSSFLFGAITTVSRNDIFIIMVAGILVASVTLIFYKELFLISVDEEIAKAGGIATQRLNQLLLVVSAVTVSVTIRIIGVLLVGALMVVPVVTAMQFGRSFAKTLQLSIVISVFSVVSGIIASYYLGTPSGGTIVVVSLFIFLLSLLWKKNS